MFLIFLSPDKLQIMQSKTFQQLNQSSPLVLRVASGYKKIKISTKPHKLPVIMFKHIPHMKAIFSYKCYIYVRANNDVGRIK